MLQHDLISNFYTQYFIMLKDYLQKIRKITDQSPQIVPYSFSSFYTCLKICCESIPGSEVTPNLIQRIAGVYKFYKNKIGMPYDQIQRQKLHTQLTDLILPFRKYAPNSDIFKSCFSHFDDANFRTNLEEERIKADLLIKSYREKGNKIHVKCNNELAYAFWVNNFKADYAVHFDIFWGIFLHFMEKNEYFSIFISQSSKIKIKQILDPDRKYYITSANTNQLFVQLCEPYFLDILAEETSLKNLSPPFQSKSFMKFIFRKTIDESMSLNVNSIQSNTSLNKISVVSNATSNFPQNQIITGCGYSMQCDVLSKQNSQKYDKQIEVACKYRPTIRFGSLADNQFSIKSPYISRRQFMIIQEQNQTQFKQSEQYDTENNKFTLVCLSPSNYTTVCYPERSLLKIGMIFKVKNELIEILNISQQFSGISQNDSSLRLFQTISEEQPTMEYLPHQKSLNTMVNITYMFLNGKNKNIKGVCNSMNNQIILGDGSNFILAYDATNEKFYLPAQTDILAKTANQVISGHMSNKIALKKGMKIKLEGIQFEILEMQSKQ